mgnify:FL=1
MCTDTEGVAAVRLSCDQADLQRALSQVSRAVSKKSTLQVLGNILIASDGERLKLAATNLEIAIAAWIDAEIAEPGSLTVRADLLTEFVSSLPSSPVQMELDRRSLALRLTCGHSKANIKGIPAEDFPEIATIGEGEPTARIDASTLREMVAQVAFAAATDDSRPVLAGVLTEFTGDTLTMAAADGFRLSVRTANLLAPPAEPIAVIVPARALQELARIIGDQAEAVDLTITPNRSQLLARAGAIEFMSRLIDGNFPNVRQIIPPEFGTRMVVSRDEFLAAARRAKLFAQSSNDVVRIQINPGDSQLDPGFATVSAQAAEAGDNEDYLEARIEGPAAHIAFNGRYLSDVLAVIHGSEIALEMTTPNAAGVLRPVGDDSYTHVIMPMVIGNL